MAKIINTDNRNCFKTMIKYSFLVIEFWLCFLRLLISLILNIIIKDGNTPNTKNVIIVISNNPKAIAACNCIKFKNKVIL